MQRQRCKGARKPSCKRRKEAAVEARSERTPVPATPVPEIQDWKLPTWARNTFKEISQGSGGLSKYVSDVHVPSAYARSPEHCHLKLRERQRGKWWLLRQEAARGEVSCPPQPCETSRASLGAACPLCCPEPVNAKGLWKRADPFSFNLGVIYRLRCWETSGKANIGKPGRETGM